jgi:hypothetical protein
MRDVVTRMREARRVSRLLLIGCVALASTFAIAQDTAAKISISLPATRLVNLLPILSEKLGLKLEAGGDVRDQVVILNVHDVEPDELLERIAHVACAEWSEANGRRTLARSLALKAKLAADDARRMTEGFARGLAKLPATDTPFDGQVASTLIDELKSVADFRPQTDGERKTASVRLWRIRNTLPTMRLAVDLIRDLGPSALASMRMGETVLSDKPTKMQGRLGPSATRFLERFAREQNAWAARVATLPEGVLSADNRTPLDPRLTAQSITGTPRVLLKIRRYSVESPMLETSLVIVDGSGKIRGFDSVSVGGQFESETPDQSLKPLLADPTRIAFSAEVVEMGTAMLGPQRDAKEISQTPGLLAAVLDPERVDPLSRSWFDGFRWIADRHRLNLVAWVPDSFFMTTPAAVGAYSGGSPFTVATAANHASGSEKMTIEGGWLLSRPEWPTASLASHTDRAVLARLTRLVHKTPYPSLEAIVSAVGTSESPRSFMAEYCSIAQPARRSFGFDLLYRLPVMRLVTSLTASQRQAVLRGESLSLSSFSAPVRANLARCFFDASSGSRTYSGRSPGSATLESEPTEAYPNGLPLNTAVRIVNTKTLFLSGVESQSEIPSDRRLVPASQIGRALARGRDTKNPNDPLQFPLFAPMVMDYYQVSVVPPGIVGWYDGLNAIQWTAPSAKLDRLPAAFLEELRVGSGGQ